MAEIINGVGPFTKRQLEILELVGHCCTNEEIGEKLGLKPNTVANRVHEIYSILDVGEGGATPRIKTIKWAQENLV